MNKSTKFLLASVSPVALAAGWAMLDSTPANAVVTVSATVHSYASENFVGASASSTILLNATAIRVGTSDTTSDFTSGFLTFTLSNSATFAAAPTATTNNFTVGSGTLVTGSTAVVYQITSSGLTTSSRITLGSFTLAGVGTRLATSNQNIIVTYGASASNVPASATATLAVGGQAYSFVGVSSNVVVDLANSGAGLVFRNSANTSNVTFASLGTLSQGAAVTTQNDITGATAFTAASGDTLRAIITGSLTGFSTVYASTASCAASAPTGSITSTLTTTSATISPLAISSLYNICALASGASIVPAGTITGVSQISFAARTAGVTTYTPGTYGQSASTLSTLSYNGSAATAFYVVGLGSYISAIRVSNPTSSAGSVFVEVTPDTTGTAVRGLLDSTLAAGQSKFYLASDIRTAVGTSVLADSNTRATVVFLTSFTGARVQNFIVNPGGVLSGGTAAGSGNTSGN